MPRIIPVFLDALDGRRRRGAHEARLELLAMGSVVDPFARRVTHSPAAITAPWTMTVINSRWPRALMRRTQKPFSALWKVTRSTRPARTSRVDDSGSACGGLLTRVPRSASPTYRGAGPRYQH